MFHIQGPVGSGKTRGIRTFCVLFSLRFECNIQICTSQNAPCDKFTEDMYETSQQCNINMTRIAAHSEVAKHEKNLSNTAIASCVLGSALEEISCPWKTNVVILKF